MSGRFPDAPVRVPVNLQEWHDVTFLHWAYDVDVIQPLLPDRLRVQEWAGVTFVGVTPFRMGNVRIPGLPPPPGWKSFAELNVRVYVTGPDGRDGIWFLGMVVPSLSFALALRSIGLPYHVSKSVVTRTRRGAEYRFYKPRHWGPNSAAWFDASVEVGPLLREEERSQLVDSLTGRWTAYHRRARILWRTPVEHQQWPLRHARVTGQLTAPLHWVGLPEPSGPPLAHAASTVHVRLGSLRPTRLWAGKGAGGSAL